MTLQNATECMRVRSLSETKRTRVPIRTDQANSGLQRHYLQIKYEIQDTLDLNLVIKAYMFVAEMMGSNA